MTVEEFNAEVVKISMGYLVLDDYGNVVSSVDPDMVYIDYQGDCNYKKWNDGLLRRLMETFRQAGDGEVIAKDYFPAKEFYRMVLHMEEVLIFKEKL